MNRFIRPSQQIEEFTVRHWVCWKMICFEYFEEIYYTYQPCDYDNYCEETFTWCYDPIGNKYVKTRISGPTIHGSVNCELEGYEITPPVVPGEESECYIYHTECNPAE